MSRNPLGNPWQGYKASWLMQDAKTMIIGIFAIALLGAPCFGGYWYYSKQKRRQAILEDALAACPQNRTRMMCMKNIEKMHDTCLERQRAQGRFNYFQYRSCVGVPVRPGQFDPFDGLKID